MIKKNKYVRVRRGRGEEEEKSVFVRGKSVRISECYLDLLFSDDYRLTDRRVCESVSVKVTQRSKKSYHVCRMRLMYN